MSYQDNRLFTLNEPLAPRLNPALACEIGLNESLLLLQIEFYISVSGHVRDGMKWIYNSTREIQKEWFPFWSHHTINRAIKSLEQSGYIHTTTKYNKLKYDKTRWFALNFNELSKLNSISIKGYATGSEQIETGSEQIETTIPETTTDIKNDVLPPPEPEPETDIDKKQSSVRSQSDFKHLIDHVPDQFRKPSVKNIIEKALKSHTEADITKAVQYTNARSTKGTLQAYRAYLDKSIDGKAYLDYQDQDQDQTDKAKLFLESRRQMPSALLKIDAEKGCEISQQVLDERGEHGKNI
jgi:hypothetical protein